MENQEKMGRSEGRNLAEGYSCHESNHARSDAEPGG